LIWPAGLLVKTIIGYPGTLNEILFSSFFSASINNIPEGKSEYVTMEKAGKKLGPGQRECGSKQLIVAHGNCGF
jgi:hypothetical protein